MADRARHFSAQCITVRDPFHPMASREVRRLDCAGPISALAPQTTQPFIILRNGEAVLRKDWQQPVADGDLMAVVLLPQGGGGGGSNPLKIILSVAMAVFAPGIGEAINLALFEAGSEFAFAVSSGVLGGAVGMAGSVLINAILPPPKPPSANGGAQSNYASASPTYSLSAQGNMARVDGAIPIQYGRLQVFPDFAAAPYVEYAGNEQYLYQLLCLGIGEYEIESIRIEDTAIASFEEVEYQVVQPNASVTLFPTSVSTSIEVSGQEAAHGAALGPFVVNAATTTANRLAFDVVTPRGLYYANDSGGLDARTITFTCEAREIDDDGDPVGSWVTLGSESITAATTTPQRRSFSYGVADGRYETRLTRTNAKDTSSRAGHELSWAGLRAYLTQNTVFGNVTLLAMKMRATNNLSQQASRKINVICTRKLKSWNGTSWSVSAETTRSPAWALADACKTIGLPDSRIDLAGLLALDAVWSARGDTFNGRFDQTLTFWEALSKIGQAVRCKPYMQGGIIHFMRDASATLPVALYSMRNIVRGSFSLEFITPTPDTADAIEVSYFDDTAWKPRRVTAKLAGSAAAKPAKVELFGVTDRAQAYKEGLYMAGANRYRRTMIKFETEMEGFIPSYGDLIAVSHDLPQWGQSGEIVSWDAGTTTAIVSEPLTWESGETHYIGLRRRDGSVSGPYVATAGVDAYHVVLATAPDFTPYTGQNEERTHYCFGWGETWRQPARVVSVRPRGDYRVEICAINEDPGVHSADTGAVTPPLNSSQLPTQFTAPVVTGLAVRSMPDAVERMIISWQPAAGADHYLVDQGPGDGTWTRLGEVSSTSFSGTALYAATTMIRVAAVGVARGPWLEIGYATGAGYMWDAVDTTLMWAADDSTLMWSN
jgi:hypothetical protein